MKIIVSAGMHRSGSTWLFNVLRHICLARKKQLHSCFGRLDDQKLTAINVIKVHRFNEELVSRADYVLLTKRDIRDIAASAVRRGMIENATHKIDVYLGKIISEEYEKWLPHIDLEIKYEEMYKKKPEYIAEIAKLIREPVSMQEAERLHHIVDALKYDEFDPVTQMHPGHITDGGVKTFTKTLEPATIHMIEKKFRKYCYA